MPGFLKLLLAILLTNIAVVASRLHAQRPLVEQTGPAPKATPKPSTAERNVSLQTNTSSNFAIDPAAERETYNLANALHSAGKYADAIPALRSFLARFPNSPDAAEMTYKLADSLRRTSPDSEEASTLFQQIVQKNPSSPFAPFSQMRLAEDALLRRDFVGSLSLLDEVIASAPTQGLRLNAIYSKILALQALDRLQETPELLDQLTAVRENNPHLPFAELALGRYYESQGRHSDALRHYNRAISSANDPALRAEAGTRAAVSALREGDTSEAIRLFDTTLRLNPPDPWLRLSRIGLIRALAAAGQHEELLRYAASFSLPASAELSLQPELLYLVATAERLKPSPDFSRASQHLNIILEKFPDSRYAQHAAFDLITTRASQGETETLLTPLRNYIDNYPDSPHIPSARHMLANILVSDGRLKDARPLLEQNFQIKQPPHAIPDTLLQLAYIYVSEKNPQKAIPLLVQLLEDYPDHPHTESALQLTAIAQESVGDYPDALATWDTLLTRFPRTQHRAEALYRSGIIHARAQRWPETLRAMNASIAADPSHPRVLESRFWRGLAAYHTGDNAAALEDLTYTIENTETTHPLHAPALQHIILIAAAGKDIERADPLARTYLSLMETNSDLPPLSAELFYWLAHTRSEKRQYTDAHYWFTRLLPLAQGNSDLTTITLLGIMESSTKINRPADALAAWQKLNTHDKVISESAQAQLLHATALLQDNQPNSAISLAEQILADARDPVISAQARLLLGDLHMAIQKPQDALRYYSTAALLYDDPDLTPAALRKAASLAKTLGQTQEAAKFEADLRTRYPNAKP